MAKAYKKTQVLLTTLIVAVLCVAIGIGIALCIHSIQKKEHFEENKAVSVLFTNDVHCGYQDNLGYDSLAAIKDTLEKSGRSVVLVDSGDAVQGSPVGNISQGTAIIDLMNNLGYSVMALGNHEFDYGIPHLLELREQAKFEMVSCNFLDADGNTVFSPYQIVDAGGYKLAFIGISTPHSVTSSTPSYFMNESGEYIYFFSSDETGDLLAEKITQAAQTAKEEGADYVIALSHLGIDESSSPFTSLEIIPKVSGIDVFLDGHSHSIIEPMNVMDKDGKSVILVQTGSKLQRIGHLEISDEEGIRITLIDNSTEKELETEITASYTEFFEQIVASSDVDLYTSFTENQQQYHIRMAETNLGDFCADAFRYYFEADIGLINGGNFRDDLPKGKLTYGQLISVLPFGNEVCLLRITGQQLLNALETSVSAYPVNYGGFLQVSGISFDVNVNIDSQVMRDSSNMVIGYGDKRRISNVMVGDEALDPAKTYTLSISDYSGLNNGDGYTAWDDAELLMMSGKKDYEIILQYIQSMHDGIIGDAYKEPHGDGRIKFINK